MRSPEAAVRIAEKGGRRTESVKGIPQPGQLAWIERMAEQLSGKLRGEAHRLHLIFSHA